MAIQVWYRFVYGDNTKGFLACGLCGAVVLSEDKDKHTSFHNRIVLGGVE